MKKGRIFMDNQNTAVAEIKNFIEKYFEPKVLPVKGTEGLVIAPNGMNITHVKQVIDAERTAPETLKGSTNLHNCKSFCDYVNRYKTDDSVVFYNKPEGTITCIFDCATKDKTSYERHKAEYSFPFSEELKSWRGENNSLMSQLDFAMFIEKNVLDLAEPPTPENEGEALKNIRMRCGGHFASVAKMVELSKGIAVRADEKAVIKHDLNTGEATIQFSSEHTDADGKPVKVPNMFVIVIPVLDGGKAYQLPCRLRYRLNNGSVRWWYEVINLDKAIEMAIDEELQEISKAVELPLFYGELPEGR